MCSAISTISNGLYFTHLKDTSLESQLKFRLQADRFLYRTLRRLVCVEIHALRSKIKDKTENLNNLWVNSSSAEHKFTNGLGRNFEDTVQKIDTYLGK